MEKNYSGLSSFFKPGLFLVVFLLFGFYGFGQSISKPNLTENIICNDSSIQLNFILTSDPGKDNRYEESSIFTLKITPIDGSAAKQLNIDMGDVPGNNSTLEKNLEVNITSMQLEEGQYTLSIHSTNPLSNSPESNSFTIVIPVIYNQTESGNDSWIGHVYDGTNFNTYIGGYTESLSFNQEFGGNINNFKLGTSNCDPSVYTETFSVRYRMDSSLNGLYTVNIGSDDGSRLNVDGQLFYDDWNDHGYRDQNILMNLTGNSNLVLDYYENGGGNQVTFNKIIQILENNLTENTNQTICAATTAAAISGDTFGTLPAGLSGAGYQWTYSTSPEGTRNNINGATSATFTPNLNATPFNNPGIYYIFRNASLSSSSNVSPNPYVATNESNPVTLTVKSVPSAPIASNNGPVCVGSTLNLFASTVDGATYSWTGPNGFTSNSQNPSRTNASAAMAGTYTVTATVDGCTSIEANTMVDVNTAFNWTGATDTDWNTASNWACNSIPNLDLNVIIPSGLTNYPILNIGDIGMAKDIQIETGGTLMVLDTLQIAGSVTANNETINSKNGSMAFVGTTSAQIIPANIFLENRIRDLIINNIDGVSSLGDLEITGFLRVDQNLSNFNTGDKLTLISDATQTALIDGSGKGNVIGSVKIQRYLDVAFGYKYFSSPFSNSTVGDFSPYVDLTASFPNFYTYDENRQDASNNAATGWEAYTESTATLGVLTGYALNFGSLSSSKTVEISGTVNNGDQQITLYNNKREYTDGFNLVGNPYPSPIDWDAATGWTKTNIDDAIYFFTAGSTNQYTGTYTSYIDGISADGRSSKIIPSMQGFFVHVSDGPSKVTATLGVKNSVRTDNTFEQQFLKVSEPETASLIRVSAGFENESKTDPAVFYFPHFAKLSFEKEKDALKLMNTDIRVPNLYSLTPENKKLSINAIPKPGSSEIKKVPMGLKIEKDGWMSINLQDLQNLPTNFNVYLIDSEKRIGQNLSRKSQYRFFVKSGQHDSRFYLMFSETELNDPAIAFDEPFSVKTVNGKVMVSMNLETNQNSVLLASTVTGQILDRKNVSGKETIEIEGIKSSGIYFFSINLKDGMFSKKVLIQK